MAQFTVTKVGEYYNLIYLGYEPTSTKLDVWYSNWTFCNTREDTEQLISAVLKLESAMKVRLKELNLNHDPKKIIRMVFSYIGNILTGNDVRASFPFDRKVDLYINSFDKKYNDAVQYCNTLLETVKQYEVNKDEQWRMFEEYDRVNDIYELGFEDITPYLKKSFFDQILDNLDNIDDKLKLMDAKFQKYNYGR